MRQEISTAGRVWHSSTSCHHPAMGDVMWTWGNGTNAPCPLCRACRQKRRLEGFYVWRRKINSWFYGQKAAAALHKINYIANYCKSGIDKQSYTQFIWFIQFIKSETNYQNFMRATCIRDSFFESLKGKMVRVGTGMGVRIWAIFSLFFFFLSLISDVLKLLSACVKIHSHFPIEPREWAAPIKFHKVWLSETRDLLGKSSWPSRGPSGMAPHNSRRPGVSYFSCGPWTTLGKWLLPVFSFNRLILFRVTVFSPALQSPTTASQWRELLCIQSGLATVKLQLEA